MKNGAKFAAANLLLLAEPLSKAVNEAFEALEEQLKMTPLLTVMSPSGPGWVALVLVKTQLTLEQ